MDIQAIPTTDFKFPEQSALFHGKVRDVYSIGDKLVMIATDRISAFDVILPRAIPCKGQVLNQIAADFLQKTSDIVPNWLQAVPDPNVSAGIKAEPFKVEMVIRGVLVGHAWREYKTGKRTLCGQPMPDGMQENDSFTEPIITPTTKADVGHDEDITGEDVVELGLASQEEWELLCDYTRKLFARGQKMARARGLVLADTKYEFARYNGKIILIDEVHTPDSSRYFYADSYDAYIGGNKAEPPRQLSKEFVREWLMERGFNGQEGQKVPEMDDDFVNQISERYIELYEKITGQSFVKPEAGDALERIEKNISAYLAKAAA